MSLFQLKVKNFLHNFAPTLLSARSMMSLKLFARKMFQVLKPEINDFPFNSKL